jgi:hypothetical protein
LIGYRERLWFVNSVKFVNHNSADIYSYDPKTTKTRFERSLFSQDAGDPVVAGGLLYWPFEDPRFSAGRGEFMVTNGRAWAWRILPDGVAFHVHTMTADKGTLFAATSAWRAGLQKSKDGGATWKVIYDHPTPDKSVSRITSLAVLNGVLYAGLIGHYKKEVKLLRMSGETLVPVSGWPTGHRTDTLRVFGKRLYGMNELDGKSTLWRTDGQRFERVAGLNGRFVRDLAADGKAVWAITTKERSGKLWRSEDGVHWSVEFSFDGQEPLDLAIFEGRIYVGTHDPGGRGTLWGPREKFAPRPTSSIEPLPPAPPPLTGDRLRAALDTLDRALVDPESYKHHGVGLHRVLDPFVRGRGLEAGEALSKRLHAPVPDLRLAFIGGALKTTAQEVARWYLLRAIALSGHGRVPPAFLGIPWKGPQNRAEKYFDSVQAAAWAVSQLGQADPETLGALMARLNRTGDPPWLTGDIIGALTVLTGKPFGRDRAAWREWWGKQRLPTYRNSE